MNTGFAYLSCASLTDVGRRRKNNEDALLCLADSGVFCVADGMGGVQGGAIASQAAVDALREVFSDSPDAAFALTAKEERGVAMRDSLAQASAKIGIPVILPGMASAGDAAVLSGSLVWSDAELGWIADWTIASDAERHQWQIRGVSFDDAFRNAMAGSLQAMSGNGNPD